MMTQKEHLEEFLRVCEKILRMPIARHIPALESTMAMVEASLKREGEVKK